MQNFATTTCTKPEICEISISQSTHFSFGLHYLYFISVNEWQMSHFRPPVEFETVISARFSQTVILNLGQIDSNSEDSLFIAEFRRPEGPLSRTP